MHEKGGTWMKKLSIPKISLKGKKQKDNASGRITNETVAEHRERVIAEGRRFKYPLQYAKHKLVINTVVVSVTAIILLISFGWWQLYVVQNTATFFYRVTQVLPLPVGSVDGAPIRYSDYFLYYRPSEYYLNKYDEIQADSADGKLQLEYKKRDAMDRATADAYARRLAADLDVHVSRDEVDDALDALRQADNGTLSEVQVNSSAQQVFGMSEQDTRAQYRNSLLRSKVAFAVDDQASKLVEDVKRGVAEKKSLKDIANALNVGDEDVVNYGVSGMVSKASVFKGVRMADIAKVKKGVVSDPFMSSTSDGYFLTRVTSANDSQVNFEFINVPLTVFSANIQELKDAGSVREYITIDPEQYMEQ